MEARRSSRVTPPEWGGRAANCSETIRIRYATLERVHSALDASLAFSNAHGETFMYVRLWSFSHTEQSHPLE